MVRVVTIWSDALGAVLNVDMSGNTPLDAYYHDTGERLSESEWDKLSRHPQDNLALILAVEEEENNDF